jgi:hypothetical protein
MIFLSIFWMHIIMAMSRQPKRGPGRRPKGDESMVQLAIRFPRRMIDAIDAMRTMRLDEPDRAAVIRELLAEALAARERKGR